MRVVLDTNVLIAAGLRGTLAETILQTANEKLIVLITSEEILEELREKLTVKFNWEQSDVNSYVNQIKEISHIVRTTESISIVERDPEDNMILECALAGKADLIVTADQDLIKLKTFRNIGIIHPKTFTWTFPEHFKKG